MSTKVVPSKEYAVNVIEIGWVSAINPMHPQVGADQPTVFDTFEDANSLASRVAANYIRLGLPRIAADVQVLSRQVIVTRDEWREDS